MNKSEIYRKYNFAFKFINKKETYWPSYIETKVFDRGSIVSELSVGKVMMDFGKVENDFQYVNDSESIDDTSPNTDPGTARGYFVDIGENNENAYLLCS